ncbi:MAG: aldo/keto reductase [Candidatus Handelsmanbacteria bacterium]|nr:aldo/keto reductase [Candidatus Handelsmanbacteria bacterium]
MISPPDFTRTLLGKTGIPVCRLGLSATYRPGQRTVHQALDQGLNFFFAYGIDGQMIRALREVFARRREQLVLATGAYNLLLGHPDLRRTLEKRLRQFCTDYIDVFLFLGVTRETHFPPRLREELYRLREEGKVRAVGMSCHDRRFAGRLAAEGSLDVLMIRYNAAHRGAEQEIFPHLAAHNPGVVSYTATRWRALLRRPRGWEGQVPTASQCYRFVLSNPHVHVCLSAPSNPAQLAENLEALRQGPLSAEEIEFMRRFGDAVHREQRWFM